MTGKVGGPFDVEYVTIKDVHDNTLSLPKLTAVTLMMSGLALLKASVDLNILRIHLRDGHKFSQLVKQALTFLPLLMSTIIFRLSSISFMLTYLTTWTLLPMGITFIGTLIYGSKRYNSNTPLIPLHLDKGLDCLLPKFYTSIVSKI